MTIAGDFAIAIVKQQSQCYRDSGNAIAILSRYYRDSVDGVVVGAVKWPCLRRVWSIMLAVLSLYFNMSHGTLSIISPLFQQAEIIPFGGFPVHILTISNPSSVL